MPSGLDGGVDEAWGEFGLGQPAEEPGVERRADGVVEELGTSPVRAER